MSPLIRHKKKRNGFKNIMLTNDVKSKSLNNFTGTTALSSTGTNPHKILNRPLGTLGFWVEHSFKNINQTNQPNNCNKAFSIPSDFKMCRDRSPSLFQSPHSFPHSRRGLPNKVWESSLGWPSLSCFVLYLSYKVVRGIFWLLKSALW